MPQTTDVRIAGAGYMLAPGGYHRASDGVSEGRARRVVLRDFFGGQRRAFQLERDRGWDGLGVHGAFGGQGVEPWPSLATFADSGIAPRASFGSGDPCPHVVLGTAAATRAYVMIDGRLYRCPSGTAGTWSGLALVADFAGTDGLQLAPYVPPAGGERIAVALGPSADLALVNPAASPANAVATFRAGERAATVAGYGGVLVYGSARPQEPHVLRISDGTDVDSRALDAPIVAIGYHQGRLAVATRSALWLLGGHWEPARPAVTDPGTGAVITPRVPARWQGEPEPFFSPGFWTSNGDFPFLVSYGGKLYTFLAHEVMEYDPGTGNQRQGWRAVGVTASVAYGACVAGGMLVVALKTWRGLSEIWAFDGSAWWRVARRLAGTGATACWPMPTAGAGDRDLLVFRDDSASYDLARLIARGPDRPAYAASGEYLTSLLDGGERDQPKVWRAAGAVFAAPDEGGTPVAADPVTVQLHASLDAGTTWLPVAARAIVPTERNVTISGPIPATASGSVFVQLRVTWGGIGDAAPTLAGLWAEYEPLDVPTRRRRWSLSVMARDGLVERDGGRHDRDGAAQIDGLWSAWRSGATVDFRDLDFDRSGETYRVRITGIDEQTPRPADRGRQGDALIRVNLVEV
jgi:hypothetical protein